VSTEHALGYWENDDEPDERTSATEEGDFDEEQRDYGQMVGESLGGAP
jgi:hypothetical protein